MIEGGLVVHGRNKVTCVIVITEVNRTLTVGAPTQAEAEDLRKLIVDRIAGPVTPIVPGPKEPEPTPAPVSADNWKRAWPLRMGGTTPSWDTTAGPTSSSGR